MERGMMYQINNKKLLSARQGGRRSPAPDRQGPALTDGPGL